ncbi:MAG: DUF6868 family protein [Planctomycetota bacterium]
MTLEQLTEFFKWMMIINIGVMAFSTVLVVVLKHAICKLHGKLFGLTENQIAMACYAYLGMYKVVVTAFFIVPYVALVIIQ